MTTKTNPPAIKEEVDTLALAIEKGLTLDNTSGGFTPVDNLYVAHIPETLSVEAIRQTKQYDRTFSAATTLAMGRLSIKGMEANPDLEKTTLEVKTLEGDSFAWTMDRKTTDVNRFSEAKEEVTTYGKVRMTVHQSLGNGSKGDLGAARKNVSHLAQLALAAASK